MSRNPTLRILGKCAGVACLTVLAATARADQPPPRYIAAVLADLPNGGTQVQALNNAGMSTGSSGLGVPPNAHAFLGSPDGTLENIETLDCDGSVGYAINSSNQIAGMITVSPDGTSLNRPMRYTPGVGMIDLGIPADGSGLAVDINEAGDTIGGWFYADSIQHAFIYTDQDGLMDLGSLGPYSTLASDVNEARQVVGWSETSDTHKHAFLWEDGVMQDLGTLGGDESKAYYINNQGVIVGGSMLADGTWQAFRYTAQSGMQPLPPIPNMAYSAATWITDSGVILGEWWDSGDNRRAFYYSDDVGMIDLSDVLGPDNIAGPVAANDAGQAVLWMMDSINWEMHAYVYSPEMGAHDVNDMLADELAWTPVSPYGINESGQIVAVGFNSGRYGSVLLTPLAPGDLDADGDVDQQDLGILLADWGCVGGDCDGDCDADGDTDQGDLGVLLAHWGGGA